MSRTSKRPPPRQARAAAKRALLLEATERLLSRVSPSELTTKAVASEAGVPIGSLYRYFANADDLLRALLDSFNAETMKALEEAATSSRNWREETARSMAVVRRMHERHPAYGAVAAATGSTAGSDGPAQRALEASLLRAAPGLGEERAHRMACFAVAIVEAAERQHHHLGGEESMWVFTEAQIALEAYLERYLDPPQGYESDASHP